MHIFPRKQNNIPGSISALTAAKIFDFNMYLGVLKILDDNNEYTYSLGGQTMFLEGQTMFLGGQTTFQGGKQCSWEVKQEFQH